MNAVSQACAGTRGERTASESEDDPRQGVLGPSANELGATGRDYPGPMRSTSRMGARAVSRGTWRCGLAPLGATRERDRYACISWHAPIAGSLAGHS
jgi:hypothetical protein